MHDDLPDTPTDGLPMLETTLLWSMRAWAIGAHRKVDVSARLRQVFRGLGAPGAERFFDGFMWALNRGAVRMLEVNCVCQPEVSDDENDLLDVLALAQENRPHDLVRLLCELVSEPAAQAGCESATLLARTLNAAGQVLPRAPGALRRHALTADRRIGAPGSMQMH